MTTTENVYIVKKGNSPWQVACTILKQQGKKVDNATIIAEINRLAKINGCNDVEDFSDKFFNSIGKEIKYGDSPDSPNNKKSTPATQKPQSTTKTGNAEIDRINALSTDTQRIVEYNKKNYQGQYYGIVDKKQCKLFIYDKSGKVIKSFEVGVGKKKGDNLGAYYLAYHNNTKNKSKAEQNRYTTSGEFTLDELKSSTANYTGTDGKIKIMNLKGDNRGVESGQPAIHMVPQKRPERQKLFGNGNINDNRMSYGCVNLKEEDYDIMHQYLGEGYKIYILPEEQGNKLLLEKQNDGSFKFAQQYHKNDKRGVPAELASKVKYDVRPERAPKKTTHTQQKQETEQKTVWYNPLTWF